MSRIHEVLQVPGSWARGFLGFHMFSVLTVPGSWVRGSHTFAVPTVPSSQSWSGRSESRFSVPGCQGPGTSHRSLRSRQAMARERVVIDTNVFRERSAFNRIHSGPVCRLFVTLLSPRFDRYVSRERREALLLRLAPIVQVVACGRSASVVIRTTTSFSKRRSTGGPAS